ncbi:hypothetical protein [Acinetobacter johnsonii]|nr:hypothetical protein [Acinetobacter johnsonii]
MEIQNEKEAFERFKAKQIGIDYETLKKDLDDCEKRFPNNRYAGWNFKSDWELWQAATAQSVPDVQQALNDRLLVRSIKEQVESPIAEISVNDLFDKGWFAAMKCIQSNIDMLEVREPTND